MKKNYQLTKTLNITRSFISLFLLNCTLISEATADQYHYNNIVIGDRAAGMGGAYTAIADDPSGLFYNPAGIIYATTHKISASANAFHTTTTTYKSVIGGNDWIRSSTTLTPNFFGITRPLGKGTFGFSYAVTDSLKENQDQVFNSLPNIPDIESYSINFNNNDTTYKIGPSYSLELTPSLSFGATLYYHSRERETITNQVVTIDSVADDREWQNYYYETTEGGLNPIVGIIWSPADELSLGLTIRQTIVLSSQSSGQSTCAGDTLTDYAGTNCLNNQTTIAGAGESTDTKRLHPVIISFGAAWFASKELLVSGDVKHHMATTAEAFSPFPGRNAVTNISLGVEYYLNSSYALRTGYYTNYANTPALSSTITSGQEPNIDITGLTFSLSKFTPNSSITFGMNYATGSGQSQLSTTINNVDIETITAYMSTSYAY